MIEKEKNSSLKSNYPLYSFTGAITGIFLLLLYYTLFFILFAYLLIPFSLYNYSFFDVFLLRFMIIIIAPIVFIPFTIPLFPYQKIDLKHHSIRKTFVNLVFSLCTIPFLLIFIYIEYFLINFDPVNKRTGGGIMLTFLLLIIPLLSWAYVSLHFKEFIFGKDSSQTLRYFREIKRQKSSAIANLRSSYSNPFSDKTPLFTFRWFIIICGILGLPFAGLMLIFHNIPFFFVTFIQLLSLDIFVILFSLPFYNNLFKTNKFLLRRLTAIYQYIFGIEDISMKSFWYGISILATIWMLMPLAVIFPYPQKYFFFAFYFISIFIFVITIWNNQFKKILNRQKSDDVVLHTFNR